MQIEYTLSEITSIAQKILEETGHAKCLAFFAPMGAGKTTLIHQICVVLGVTDTVSSPTYSIINEYRTHKDELIVHMDWYRLEDETDALNTGVEDYMLGANLCLIEWPERAVNLLPKDCIRIELKVLTDTRRHICIIK